MKKNIIVFFIICLILLPNISFANPSEAYSKEIAQKLLLKISNNNYSEATENFDTTMKKLLQAEQIKSVWEKLLEQCGDFKSIDSESTVSEMLIYKVVKQKVFFENMILYAVVSIDTAGKIAGLHFTPATDEAAPDSNYNYNSNSNYKDASYVIKANFIEEDIKFPDGIITGKLTIPINKNIKKQNKNEKFPLLILVHGSGPNDADETIYNNKVFRDIAYGLSSRNIAVLRYNKRTLVDKNLDINNLTINEETVNDVITAVEIFSKDERFSRIYILGHSLGAYILPRISNLSSIPSGFISLAGSARALPKLIIEQTNYIYSLDSTKYSLNDKKNLQQQIENCQRVLKNNYDVNTPSDSLPLGVPAKYWLDLQNYDPVEELKKEKRPILFLQGGRDYQVTTEDFEMFQKELENPKNKFILFPELNHLFQTGSKKSIPKEYTQKQNVSEKIINEIEKFIKQ